MAYKFSAYLEGPEQLDQLIALATRLGYTRIVAGTTVANLSAFLRALASGEIVCTVVAPLDLEVPR